MSFPGYNLEHWMVDTSNCVWEFMKNSKPGEDSIALMYDLNKTEIGDWFFMGYMSVVHQFRQIYDTGTGIIFGKESHFRVYEGYLCNNEHCPPDSMRLQLGLRQLVTGIGDVYHSADGYHQYLNGAIIDGQQYGTIVGINDKEKSPIPQNPILYPAYPNPFNNRVAINFTLVKHSKVNLSIYNILGRKIRELSSEYLSAGGHQFFWDCFDQTGNQTASGIYILKLDAGNYSARQKLIYIK